MKFNTWFGRLTAGFLFATTVIPSASNAGPVKLNSSANELRIIECNESGFRVSFSFSGFGTLDIKTPEGIFTRINVPAYARFGEAGHPEAPVQSKLIEVPAGAKVEVKILRYSMKEYSLDELGIGYPLMPRQPPVPKNGKPAVFVYDKEAYRINAFAPADIAAVEMPGTMRGVRIGRFDIRPVQYNPVTGKVRIYESLEIEVIFENADIPATQRDKITGSNRIDLELMNLPPG
jgi:hypothetical protein